LIKPAKGKDTKNLCARGPHRGGSRKEGGEGIFFRGERKARRGGSMSLRGATEGSTKNQAPYSEGGKVKVFEGNKGPIRIGQLHRT